MEIPFDSVLYCVSRNLRDILCQIPSHIKENTEEIRLRSGSPIALTVSGKTVFIRNGGQPCFYISRDLPNPSAQDIEESFRLICGNSFYAHEEEIKNGFVSMKNGCRAGICGTLSEKGFIQNITSINIRIAREVVGSANSIAERYSGGGLLIAGPPASGKTTILRDLIRQLSSGVSGEIKRIVVIDSRGEIFSGMNLGGNTDVIKTADKAKGIEIALRTMNPDIIAFDEIGTTAELEGVKESLYSGADIITTAHSGSAEELLKRNITKNLIRSGAIKSVAFLPEIKGDDAEFFNIKELEIYADS